MEPFTKTMDEKANPELPNHEYFHTLSWRIMNGEGALRIGQPKNLAGSGWGRFDFLMSPWGVAFIQLNVDARPIPPNKVHSRRGSSSQQNASSVGA